MDDVIRMENSIRVPQDPESAVTSMFTPRNEYLAIAPDPLPTRLGSVLLPESHRDRILHQGDGVLSVGTVVASGPGMLITKGPRAGEYLPNAAQPGDRVVYPRHELVPILDDGVQVLHSQHLFGILDAS